MAKFVTKNIDAVKGKQKFEQLIILPDDVILTEVKLETTKGVWQTYSESLEGKYQNQKRGLEAIMNRVATLQSLSNDKFKDITPKKESIKEYEIKYQDLRAYAIQIFGGKLVVLGGYKNNQEADISEFRGLKAKYLEFLKKQQDEKQRKK